MALYDPEEIPTIVEAPKKLSKRQRQRNNLKMLADYLWRLPPDYKHFDMGSYHWSTNEDFVDYTETLNKCGTSACAVGHAPAAGISLRPKHMRSGKIPKKLRATDWEDEVDWCGFTNKEFLSHVKNDDNHACVESYLFGGHWRDNTPKGAAQRIYRFLDLTRDKKLLKLSHPELYEIFNDGDIEHYKDQQPVEA